MDRLSALDAEFLHLEDGSVHMAIAGACVFSDPPPTVAEVEHLIASKMHLIARYPSSWAGPSGSTTPTSTSATTCATPPFPNPVMTRRSAA